MTGAVSLATVPLSRFHSISTQPASDASVPHTAGSAGAYDVFCDFAVQSPLVVQASTTVDAARRWVRQARARLLIVVDALETFLGVVTVADLFSGKSLHSHEGTTGKPTIADVLTPKSRLWGIPLAALTTATLADLEKTFGIADESHLLVVDADRHVIRGLVSRADVALRRQLVAPSLPIMQRASQVSAPETLL